MRDFYCLAADHASGLREGSHADGPLETAGRPDPGGRLF